MLTAALLLAACDPGDGIDDDGAVGSTGAPPAATDSGSEGSDLDSGSGDSGIADSGESGSESGDTGEPLPECPPRDDSVLAAFSAVVDGTPIVIDYSGFHGPATNAPLEWNLHDLLPEIDGMCDVLEPMPGSLTLACSDTDGADRTFSLLLDASESLSTKVGAGPVYVFYMLKFEGDMLEHVSDTVGHSFVVSNDAGIVLAGIDGRYSFDDYASGLYEAWPDWPDATVSSNTCAGPRDEATLTLEDGSSVSLFDGSAGDLGPYRVLVETARHSTEFDGEFDYGVPEARWLLGLPE